MADKKAGKAQDHAPDKSFKDGDVGWVKDADHDEGERDADLRGDDPNAGLGSFRYFDLDDSTNREIALWADWNTEAHQLYGPQVLYYRLSHVGTNMDRLYGEDQLERYGRPNRASVLFEDINEPNRFYSAFGMMADDIFTMTMTKDEYSTKIDSTGTPRVGDVIRTIWNNINYEVTYVYDHPTFTYVANIWYFTLKRFEFSYQENVTPNIQQLPQDVIVSDSTASEGSGGDNLWIEEKSDDLVDYDDHPDILNDDLYGEY